MNWLSGIGNFIGGAVHNVANFFNNDIAHPVEKVVQAQQQPNNPYNLGHFLQTHLGQPVANAANRDLKAIKVRLAQVPNVHLQGLEQLTGHPVTLGSIAQSAANYEKHNPYLNQGPTPKTAAEARAQILDPKNIDRTMALVSGTSDGGGAGKFVRNLADEAAGKVEKAVGTELPKIVGNGFTQSVKNSPEVSSEVRGQVSGQHAQRSTSQLVSDVQNQIKTLGPKKALDQTLTELAVKPGNASDETLARAIELAKQHDASGTPTGQDTAARLYDQVAEHGTAHGQGSQILSMLARRSPAGLRNKAFRDLKKAGVNVTDSIRNEIQGHIDRVRGMEDGPAKDMAIAVLQKAVAKHLPQNKVDQAVSVWKAGLLSGVKTQGGNFLSNATFGALKKLADPISTAADKGISLVTGQRGKTLTVKGDLSGAGQGLGTGLTTMKTGIDTRNVGDKYEQHAELNFKNPLMQKFVAGPANFVFRGMNAADQPFYYSALKNSLYDQAKADGLNAGKSGKALSEHMTNLVQNPTEKMVTTATKEANKSVLGFDTAASKLIQGAQQKIDQMKAPEATKAVVRAVVNVLAPFTRVPSAFLSRTVDFTPLGLGRTVFEQVAAGKFDQRALAQAIGEGATGTGLVALGISLAQHKQLSGDFPNDPKEQARWKAEGITPNSVKLGNQWISLNYMGPIGLLFNAGAKMAEAGQSGNGGQLSAALGGLGQGLLNQSFLQGLSGFVNAAQDPSRYAQSFVNSQAGSVVPAIVNDLGNATDSMQRQVNGVEDAIKARIPGARETLQPKIDSFGNDLSQASGSGLNTAINPFKPSNSVDSPMLSELNRLSASGKGNAVFPVTTKTIGSGPTLIKLTPEQATQRQKMVGQMLTPLWNQIISDPGYKSLDDGHKSNALQSALTDVQSAVDRQMTANIDSSKLTKAATGNTAKILAGTPPTAQDYLAKQTPRAPKVAKARTSSPKVARVAKGSTRKSSTGTKKYAALQTKLTKPPKLAALKLPKAPKLPKLKTSSKPRYAKLGTIRTGKKLKLIA